MSNLEHEHSLQDTYTYAIHATTNYRALCSTVLMTSSTDLAISMRLASNNTHATTVKSRAKAETTAIARHASSMHSSILLAC